MFSKLFLAVLVVLCFSPSPFIMFTKIYKISYGELWFTTGLISVSSFHSSPFYNNERYRNSVGKLFHLFFCSTGTAIKKN